MRLVPTRYVEPVRDVADVADDGDMGALRPPRRLEDMSATWIACSLGALTSPLDINGVFERERRGVCKTRRAPLRSSAFATSKLTPGPTRGRMLPQRLCRMLKRVGDLTAS